MTGTNYEAPHYAIFFGLLLLPPLRFKYYFMLDRRYLEFMFIRLRILV
jgi:hypothetical protein